MTTQPIESSATPTFATQPTTPLPEYAPQAGQGSAQQPPVQVGGAQGNAFAITSFVLGIASIVAGWTFIAPVIGLILGIIALRRRTQERVLALWGVWLNAAMLALSALIATVIVGIFGISVVGGAFAGAWG